MLFAQQKDFEGVAVYKPDVRSKTEGVSNQVWKTMLFVGDKMTVLKKW